MRMSTPQAGDGASLDVNLEILVSARESRGLTQSDVAAAIGVSQGLISKFEDGLTALTRERLVLIAEFLGFPLSLFLEPDRIRSGASACLYHRKRKTLPAKILNRLQSSMYLTTVHTDRLLREVIIESDRTFHTMDLDEYNGSPVRVAQALRAAWRVGPGPIKNLTRLIEHAGGVIVMAPFGTHKLFGMSCWGKVGRPLFYLNSEMPTADLRWTLAHELGHLTMHASAPLGDAELEADEFAREFLCPVSEFRPQVKDLTFKDLPSLKAYWKISMKAIIKSANAIDAIPTARAVSLYKQYNNRKYQVDEPYPVSSEPPHLLRDAMLVHLN